MNCQECRDLFDDMLDRRIKEPLKRRMLNHLTNCPECSAGLERRRKAHAALFRALNHFDGLEHLSGGFADRLVAECRRPQPWWQNFTLSKWALVAASLVLMVGFVFAATVVVDAIIARDDDSEAMVGRVDPNAPQATEGTDGSAASVVPAEASAIADVPSTDNQPPTTGNQHPTTDNQHPTTDSQPPTTGSQQQTTGNHLKGEYEMNIRQKAATALAATTIMMAAASARGDKIYENDFATRRSESAPRSVKTVYEYDKGGPIAYDYDHSSSFNPLTGIYPWSSSTVYSQQDGWFKKNAGSDNRGVNRGRTSVTEESNPALVFSTVGNSNQPATNQNILIMHPLRNVFTNGILRAQFDVRQPESYAHPKLYSWFRLVAENDMKNSNTSVGQFPLEVGLSANNLSGGWRKDGDADGNRTFFTFGTALPLHWYRYYVTCNLDTQTSSFEVYDLGTSRTSMDVYPSGDPVASRGGLLFRKNLTNDSGGISGIGIRVACIDTEGYYGEATFNGGRAYMYDNIRVAWMVPETQTFEDCYRNDFSKSERRTIDGSGSTSYEYVLSEQAETSTFTYPDELVRAADIGTRTGKPYLPAAFGSGNSVQKSGIDGWRFAGDSGYTGPIVLTTNGANRVGMLTKNCAVLQPMCEDITSGIVKMEWDMRMPKGWNGSYGYSSIVLTSNKGYDTQGTFVNTRLLALGLSSASGSAANTYSMVNSGYSNLYLTYNSSWASNFKPLEWYRIQLFIDLDKRNYWFYVYDVGASAPVVPDSFDSSDPANALVSKGSSGLFGNAVTRDGAAIGACGFLTWNNPDEDVDYAVLVDNIRLWKSDGNDGWELVFKNDFSTTTRTFKRRSLNLQKQSYLDRPEYGEDGWSFMPSYNYATRIAGGNPALECGDNIFSIVHPIGQSIKFGKLYAQYDMRVPVFWSSRMDYFWLQFGGGALASASTWTVPSYRQQYHRTIRTGMQMGMNGNNGLEDGTTGVHNRTAVILQDGNGAGGDGSTKAVHIGSSYVGHWIRIKMEADMGAKTWICAAYDLGTAHPTLATEDGTLLDCWENLHFNFNEPISHVHIIGGRSPSYMPWREDAPGALMVDNILIRHDKVGMRIVIR